MYYRLGLYEKSMPGTLQMRDKLVLAKECGFDYLEMSIDESDEKLSRLDMTSQQALEIVKAIHDTGVPISSICLSAHRKYPLGSPDPEAEQRSLDIMKKAISLASMLSVRQIQIAGYDIYYGTSTEQTRTRFEKNLLKCVEMASQAGVILAFETMETEFINTVEKAMKYVKLANSPYLHVYPDLGNITNAAVMYGSDVLNDMEKGRGHLSAMHLKETVPGVFREVTYGKGHVDFSSAIKKALDMGVRMFVGEFWYTGNDDWKQVLIDSAVFLRDKFPKETEV